MRGGRVTFSNEPRPHVGGHPPKVSEVGIVRGLDDIAEVADLA